MSLIKVIGITSTLIAATFVASASAQEQQPPQQPPAAAPAAPAAPPPFATTKVEGTDNVYIFRYGGHQSMFIVTPAGVIATDPISERRPAKPYIDAIQAVTKAPIKYVIYSHSHYDHIAGGKPFKDMGATFVAHKNAKARLQQLKPADVVIPDQVVDGKRNITLGGTTLELNYVGKNHSDSMLVMRLPKEKIIFTVDWIPIQGVQFRGMSDNYLPDFEDSLKKVIAMDWDTLIPGHPWTRRQADRHQGRRAQRTRLSAGPVGGGEEGRSMPARATPTLRRISSCRNTRSGAATLRSCR